MEWIDALPLLPRFFAVFGMVALAIGLANIIGFSLVQIVKRWSRREGK